MHRIEEVVARDMCIGCGACVLASDGAVTVSLGPTRTYAAQLDDASPSEVRAASRVCPFSDESPNEDALSAPHPDGSMVRDPHLGTFRSTFGGRVADDRYLSGSSSGGLTSWLISELISTGRVDAAIVVGPQDDHDEHFAYEVVDGQRVRATRKSHYYASTMADALTVASQSDQRFVIVGVPCFIRAARALCREKPDFAKRIEYFVALVCGHYKSQAFGESLAWQLGVPPSNLEAIDFRVKSGSTSANDYKFGARERSSGEWRTAPVSHLIGGNWGHNAFQPEACNFCDDVVGETADISFGDAWLPEFVGDPRGTNVVVCRNTELEELMIAGADRREIELFAVSPDDVKQSQAGGFRHRRQGLSIRLNDDLTAGLSVPVKRVPAEIPDDASERRVALIRHRRKMARQSHRFFAEAVRVGDLRKYLSAQKRAIAEYERIEHPLHRRVVRRSRARIGKLVRRGFRRA